MSSLFQGWDLVKLTQNYLKLLLRYLQENSSGLLIHCISGWDRTPLFISLLRLSLWADGVVHQSLNPAQILYFTIAYDWMLFGHNLEDRLSKGEEIFFFCFYFLKHIVEDEFSVIPRNIACNPQLTWPPQVSLESGTSPLSGLGSFSISGPLPGSKSPHPSRTSPVAVPVPGRLRHRNESSSSMSAGR
ncbi:hypothetical protein J437_LFUL019454 [Ladona fulva]|uniref:Myotubularin phosphatase domain-containing protein n=1 Tax=Ladona fulva TaxID=123851 RepID=A0A8K0KRD3_LADFU|nr:hypothetical protein J437_LFUL019454 [Ladona fulva]